jgi:hypothetical protein
VSNDGDGGGTGAGTSADSVKVKFEVGQQVVYTNGQVSDMARIKSYDDYEQNGRRNSRFKIEFPNGDIWDNIRAENLSLPKEVDPIVEKVLGILNLREETDNHFRARYPKQKEFEEFFLNTTEEVKAKYKQNGKWKEPRYKRSDREDFIILCRWIEDNQAVKGKIDWEKFNKESFSDFRKQAPKDDLFEILKELGIYNNNVVKALEEKNVQTPAHFVQKPKSWFEKLCIGEPGTEENSNHHHLLLNGTEKYAIEKFRAWYNFHFIGYLPSDWIVSFRNDDVHPKEREMRKVLRVIGLGADAIQALKMNDIRDVTALNRTSMDWRTEDRRSLVLPSFTDSFPGTRGGDWESRSNEWKLMGLTRNDASDIINFRHWYKFYVAGKNNMKGWAAEFNSTQYRNFVQRYEPGDNFKKPSLLRSRKDKLTFSQEKKDYYEILQRAAEAGDVTGEQRYNLLQYMEKREKMSLIEEITSHHEEGLGENSLQESRLKELLQRDDKNADEKVKNDLLFYQHFFQFFFSALLVMVLLVCWTGTTVYLMTSHLIPVENGAGDGKNEYVTFIHNVVFGLITAVVIQELGEESKETSLYHRFLETYREQKRRSSEYLFQNELSLSGFRGRVMCYWYRVKEWGKTSVMRVILWSTRLYIIFWIILGAASLAFGAIQNLDTSNPLYTTGQTWLGIAVTIGYAYFGLSDKNTPKGEAVKHKNEQQPNDAIQNAIDGGSDSGASATIVEVKFTDENGKTKVFQTRHELMKDIDRYEELRKEARTDRKFRDAAGYQECLDQLEKLKPMLPSQAELEKQLQETEAEINAAADTNDFDTAEKLSVIVEELQEKLKEETKEEETVLS